ncbi:MAG: MBL fold metallo-hydrolase [Propionibacteriaceae bacterium]|nr:MBL fold metallo-hydrolase [Propionibacteriaceae bacterium]
MTIRSTSVSSFDNNVYLITAKSSGCQIIVDAADDPAAIRMMIAEAALDTESRSRVRLIITTHRHRDHLCALSELASSTGAQIACGEADADSIAEQTGVRADRRLKHGDVVGVVGAWLTVIALRGHTPGSVALAYTEPGQPARIFTGDSLFPGGVGNTDHDPVRFEQLFSDVTKRIFDMYTDDTIILPGHGGSTTLGAERPHLPEWRQRGW